MNSPHLDVPVVRYRQHDRDYRNAEGISQSSMKELLISPAHFLARYGPDAEPFFPTAAMIQGTAVHARVLEPETFDQLFYDRSQKEKEPTVAELKALLEDNGTEIPKGAKKDDLMALAYPDGRPVEKRTSLAPEDYRAVFGAAEALRTHDIAGMWFDPGQREYRRFNEVSIYIRNELGQVLKGRIDRLQVEGDTVKILDLKTTQSANPSDFQRTCANLKYDLQAAWYHLLVSRAFPDKKVEFYFVALERKAPYGIGIFRASDALLISGRRRMAKALDLYAQCRELDYWPGYEPVIHELTLPSWAESREDSSEF